MTVQLQGLTIAVVGGDAREQEISRAAAGTGAQVRAYGFPWPSAGIAGVTQAGSAGEAMDGADYAIFPVPGLGPDGSLYAPHAPGPIVPDAALLGRMKPGAAIIMGRADERARQAAEQAGASIEEYEQDQELMLLRAPAIVEGVLALAVTNTNVTVHRAVIGVVGFGNVGAVLARTLIALGAQVHVFARSPVQRAASYAAACLPHDIGQLARVAPLLSMLFSTVPAPVVGRQVLSELPPGSLVVDIAAPPGGVDLVAAEELGHRALWARGMGASAPVTVGASQWTGIVRRICQREERKMREGAGHES